MIHDCRYFPKEWTSYKATTSDVQEANNAIYYTNNTCYKDLLDNNYFVRDETEFISSSLLEKKLIDDWTSFLFNNEGSTDNKLYQIASYCYKKKYPYCEDSPSEDRSHGIGQEYTHLRRKLNIEPGFLECRTISLINRYLDDVGIAGIVGLELDYPNAYIFEDVLELSKIIFFDRVFDSVLRCNAHIFKGHKKIDNENTQELYKFLATDVSSKISFIIHLLSRIGRCTDLQFELMAIIESSQLFTPEKFYKKNTNLGLDQMQSLFLKSGNDFAVIDATADTHEPKLQYRSIDEIGDFFLNYFYIIEDGIGNYKTGKGFEKRLEKLSSDESSIILLQYMIKLSNYHRNLTLPNDLHEIDVLFCTLYQNHQQEIITAFKQSLDIAPLLFKHDLPQHIIKKYLADSEPIQELKMYIKIKCCSMLAQNNLFDLMVLLSTAEDDFMLNTYFQYIEWPCISQDFPFLFLITPAEPYDLNIYAAYAISLSQNIEKQRYHRASLIWSSLERNLFDITQKEDEKHTEVTTLRTSAHLQQIELPVSNIDNLHLSKLLKNKSDSKFKEKRENIISISHWFSKQGFFPVDPDKYEHFKAIYDVIYEFEPNQKLKDNKIQIRKDYFKSFEEHLPYITEEAKNYLTFGIYMSVLFNEGKLSELNFIRLCGLIKTCIVKNYHHFDLSSMDKCLILLNKDREDFLIALDSILETLLEHY